MAGTHRPVVAIAGATGFVGQALRRALVEDYEVVALTRSPTRAALADASGVRWRHCDLFSMGDVEAALAGVDYAIYLVHSMLPSARLTQASFADLDLLLADNFARAAEKNGVRQILYVGGIRPPEEAMSTHLRSRLEVEATLSGRTVPVTALRAGIILGPGGSSMAMMVHLVRRLPAMVLPAWTASASAPIDIGDVVRAVRRCLGRAETFGRSFDIGGPETMTYRAMLERTAQVLGRRLVAWQVPVFSTSLSRRWVSWVTGAPDALVGPLVESLRHSLVPAPNELQDWLEPDALRFDEALRRSLDTRGRPVDNPRVALRRGDDDRLRVARTVRSVQRLPLPPGSDVGWVAEEYMRWLPTFVWPFLEVRSGPQQAIRFVLRSTPWALLELTPVPAASLPDRRMFRITGGLLARLSPQYRGRFEFREVLQGQAVIAAIHDFRPMLPWYVYNVSQALVHLVVMKAFGRHLKTWGERQLSAGPPPRRELPPGPGGDGTPAPPTSPGP